MLWTILLFFIYIWAFGFSVTFFIKKENQSKSWLERQIMNMGIGLGVWTFLIIIVNTIGLPLDWRLFLLWCLAIPVYAVYEKIADKGLKFEFKMPKFQLKKSTLHILLVVIMGLVLFSVFHKGTFSYPWLEDGDPWEHASGTLYVSEMKTYTRSAENLMNPLIHYLEPYPPTYDSIMGILRQTYQNTNWVLKFFNVLMIALGHIWFYFFAKEFMRDANKALFATFAFVVVPCFLGHFIWSTTLAMVLYFPAFYCIEKLKSKKENFNWIYPAILVIAGLMVAQPSDAFFFGIFFAIYYLVTIIQKKKMFWRMAFAGGIGVLLSMIYWIPTFLKFPYEDIKKAMAIGVLKDFAYGGKQARYYTLKDLAISPLANMFDNPTGFGIFLFTLGCLGFAMLLIKYLRFIFTESKLTSKNKTWMSATFLWFAFGMVGTLGSWLPFPTLYPYRMWSKWAIPMALLSAYSFYEIYNFLKNKKMKEIAWIFATIVVIGMIWTSGYPKYVVQTSLWAPHIYNNPYEIQAYTRLTELPMNSRMFHLCNRGGMKTIEERFVGYGMNANFWDPEERKVKRSLINQSAQSIHQFGKNYDYKYMVVDYSCVNEIGINETNSLLEDISQSGLFKPAILQSPLYVLELA
jgi:hypothetical protein